MLRQIDRFVDFGGFRQELAPFYGSIGRPSIDRELLIRMLIVGYCFAIRSERRLCEVVHLNLAFRWFCGLGLDGKVPDHSTFPLNRNGRFRDSSILRHLFENAVRRCMSEGLVGGEQFAVDASLIQADGWNFRARGLHVRCRGGPLHLSGRQQPPAISVGLLPGQSQVGQRWAFAIPHQKGRLRCPRLQEAMLPEGTCAQAFAQHQ